MTAVPAGPDLSGEHRPVIVIGGGQAGLSMSRCLGKRGVDHLVLERATVADSWKSYRWDTFCLVTPNWQCNLPDFPYAGDDPHGFMVRSQIVDYLEAYRAFVDPPLVEGVEVTSLTRDERGTFRLVTTAGECTADQVVVATGGYHTPITPPMSEPMPPSITQVQSQDYRSGAPLPDGEVLVVGSGQSGAQIAEDLHLEGRRVHLVVGNAPRVARFYRGRDVTDWLDEMGYYQMPVTQHPRKEAVRAQANHYVTGRDGGRDIDLRAHARDGMRLYGVMTDHRDGTLHFEPNLTESLDHADEVSRVHQGHDRRLHREAGRRRARRGPLRAGLEAGAGGHRAPPGRHGHHVRGVVHRLPPGLPVDRRPGLQRARRPGPHPRHRRARPACTSSAWPGSGRGARAASPGSARTRSTSPSASARSGA